MTRSPLPVIARVAVWLLALVTTITGITFVNTRTGVEWQPDGAGSFSGEPYDITGLGTALLCVGLLILAALLIAEAYRPRVIEAAPTDSASTDSASTPGA